MAEAKNHWLIAKKRSLATALRPGTWDRRLTALWDYYFLLAGFRRMSPAHMDRANKTPKAQAPIQKLPAVRPINNAIKIAPFIKATFNFCRAVVMG